MFPNCRSKRITDLSVTGQSYGPISKLPPKYSDEDWVFNNENKIRITKDQQLLADRVLAESQRMMIETSDVTKNFKREVDHHLRGRTEEIRFLVAELNKQKKTAILEEEALEMYRRRLLKAIAFLKEKSLKICIECLNFREGRLGPDLVDDEVDRQLRLELKVIRGSQSTLDKTLIETNAQLRKLRAAMYLLNEDLEFKEKSLMIDEANLVLRHNPKGSTGDHPSLRVCSYSIDEWEHKTHDNIEANSQELNSAGLLRGYVDLLLKQTVEDLINQNDRTNYAFSNRITEVTKVKRKLEEHHNSTMSQINDIQNNLDDILDELKDKEGYMNLCTVRLANRAKRPGLELTCDPAQTALYNELDTLNYIIAKINQKVVENKATLRYLLHVQLMQAEEINIKTNSLKIDEVDCVPLRQTLRYQKF